MADEALSGLKVVELAKLISGSHLGRVLAGFGAEVIKVEVPPGGDEARTLGPFPGDIPHPERSGMFLYLNVNKRGVAAGPAVDTEQFVTDPHRNARGFFAEADHDEIGRRLYGGWPVHLGEVEPQVGKIALLGEHNEGVFLGSLGLSREEYQRLQEEEVIY